MGVVRRVGGEPGDEVFDEVVFAVGGEGDVDASSVPSVPSESPLLLADEQKLPNPWVGYTWASSGSRSARRRAATGTAARVSSSVDAAATRSVRPTVP